jgi:hypothetical protein
VLTEDILLLKTAGSGLEALEYLESHVCVWCGVRKAAEHRCSQNMFHRLALGAVLVL